MFLMFITRYLKFQEESLSQAKPTCLLKKKKKKKLLTPAGWNWENSWAEYLIHTLTLTQVFENRCVARWWMAEKRSSLEFVADKCSSRSSDFFCIAVCIDV